MKLLVTHPLPPGTTRDDLEKMQRASQGDPEIHGYRSFLNLTEGKGICIFEAPSSERLAWWLKKNGMAYDSIFEVELEGYRGSWIEAGSAVHSTA